MSAGQASKASLDSAAKHATDDEKSATEVPSLRAAGSNVDYKAQFPEINEQKLLRKLDLRVVAFVFVANFLTFLDRCVSLRTIGPGLGSFLPPTESTSRMPRCLG